MCHPKISQAKAAQISEGARNWDRGEGLGQDVVTGVSRKTGEVTTYTPPPGRNSVYAATFTLPHDYGQPLDVMLKDVADAFRKVISGSPWVALKQELRIIGQIRASEQTHGVNGWHPHLHVLVFVEGDLDADRGDVTLVRLKEYLLEHWKTVVTDLGYREPSDSRGVWVERCYSAQAAAEYIAKTQEGDFADMKVGYEMARGDLKDAREGHRKPFEILADYERTGDPKDLALWREYERATKGHQRIAWSKKLKEILGVTDKRTDEQMAAEEVGGEFVVALDGYTWLKVIRMRGLPAEILEVAEVGGYAAVLQLLDERGVLSRRRRPDEVGADGCLLEQANC